MGEGVFVRLVVALEDGGLVLPPGTILRLPAPFAAALIEAGLAVPERTDTPAHEAERR